MEVTCIPTIIAALITIIKLCYQPRCSTTDEWIKKMLAYMHDGVLCNHEGEWNILIFRKMESAGG
jgi:hypothetical protein